MSVRDEDKINTLQRGNFVLSLFENRIHQPRIDEQNLAARCNDLESRLTIPGELRFHANHETENDAHGKSPQAESDCHLYRLAIVRKFLSWTTKTPINFSQQAMTAGAR